MKKDNVFSFAAFNAQHDTEFLSYREAIEKLAATNGDLFSDVARGLKLRNFEDRHGAWINGVCRLIYRENSGRYLNALLANTTKTNEISSVGLLDSHGSTQEIADPEEHGWYRSGFIELLHINSIPCPKSIIKNHVAISLDDVQNESTEHAFQVEEDLPSRMRDEKSDFINADLEERAKRFEQEVLRLSERLRGKIVQIAALEKAIARSSVMNASVQEKLEKQIIDLQEKLERVFSKSDISIGSEKTVQAEALMVPFVTKKMRELFEVMTEHWTNFDIRNPPKSRVVAFDIDAKMGIATQSDGEPSRAAHTYAALIRKDEESQSDGRNAKRRRRT